MRNKYLVGTLVESKGLGYTGIEKGIKGAVTKIEIIADCIIYEISINSSMYVKHTESSLEKNFHIVSISQPEEPGHCYCPRCGMPKVHDKNLMCKPCRELTY